MEASGTVKKPENQTVILQGGMCLARSQPEFLKEYVKMPHILQYVKVTYLHKILSMLLVL